MSRKLFVGNLPYSVTSERLQEAFSQFGTVTSSKVIVDRETGRSRGFAFLEMETDEQGAASMQAMNGALLDGRSIAVREAVERQPGGGGDRGGGYGGGGGGYGGGGGGGGRDGGGFRPRGPRPPYGGGGGDRGGGGGYGGGGDRGGGGGYGGGGDRGGGGGGGYRGAPREGGNDGPMRDRRADFSGGGGGGGGFRPRPSGGGFGGSGPGPAPGGLDSTPEVVRPRREPPGAGHHDRRRDSYEPRKRGFDDDTD
jgi:RNA recognition motif-containing protein